MNVGANLPRSQMCGGSGRASPGNDRYPESWRGSQSYSGGFSEFQAKGMGSTREGLQYVLRKRKCNAGVRGTDPPAVRNPCITFDSPETELLIA